MRVRLRPSASAILWAMRLVRILLIVPIVLLGVVAAANGAPREEPRSTESDTASDTDGAGKLLLVLDASGSMAEDAGGGQTRIQAAKDALRTVVDELDRKSVL